MTGVQIVKAAREEALAPSVNLLCEFELEDMCEQDPASWEHIACQKWEEFQSDQGGTRDSTTGEVLDPTKVEEGCQEEMGFMSQMHVWNRVTREEAFRDPEGKIVGTRWVLLKREIRSGADSWHRSLPEATSERTCMPELHPLRPPGTSSPTVSREGGRTGTGGNSWWSTSSVHFCTGSVHGVST